MAQQRISLATIALIFCALTFPSALSSLMGPIYAILSFFFKCFWYLLWFILGVGAISKTVSVVRQRWRLLRHALLAGVEHMAHRKIIAWKHYQSAQLQPARFRMSLCSACRRVPASVLNLPCGHVFLCPACHSSSTFIRENNNQCGACRDPTSATLTILWRADTSGPPPAPCPRPSTHLSRATPRTAIGRVWAVIALLWEVWVERLRVQRANLRDRLYACARCSQAQAVMVAEVCGHCVLCEACFRSNPQDCCLQCKLTTKFIKPVTSFDCSICFDTISIPALVTLPSCLHSFCLPCAIRYIRSGLGSVSDSISPSGLRCPQHCAGCECHLPLASVASLEGVSSEDGIDSITLQEVDRLARFMEEAAIPFERRFYCVNESCARVLDVPENVGTVLEQPSITCPHCHTEICVRCKIRWHAALTCDEARVVENDTDPRDTLSVIEATTKRCPKCEFRISHYHGHACHHILPGTGCPNCGHHFCYSCLRPSRSTWCRCSTYCRAENISANLQKRPFPHDVRCGCPICPDCRPGSPCSQSDGSCVVCRGIVPPGQMPPPARGAWGIVGRLFGWLGR